MGERDWLTRYQASRAYADDQATAYMRGDSIENWTYETDYKPGMPEPRKLRLTGAAWVAHAYDIAASDAKTLAHTTRDRQWSNAADECDRLAQHYREKESE